MRWARARLFFWTMATERIAETIDRIRQAIIPLLEREGYELVELELKRGPKRHLLRITVDRAGITRYRGSAKDEGDDGVGITDCVKVSKLLSPTLDVEDLIPTAYTLEVSSPGVDRPLKRPEHFERAIGLTIRVKTRVPVAGESFFIAPLTEVTDEGIALDVRGRRVDIPFRLIGQANIEYRF